jgi:hypothetical protein
MNTTLPDLTWTSLAYDPQNQLDGIAGPDTNVRCETPRHRFGEVKPQAAWLEILWYPEGDRSVARAWKTCEDCHVRMANTAEHSADKRETPGAAEGDTGGSSG